MGFEWGNSGAGLALCEEIGKGAARGVEGGLSTGAEHPANTNKPNRSGSMRLSIAEISAI